MSRVEIPDTWWIAEGAGGEPTVWAPPDGNPLGYPTPVVEERAASPLLWGLLAAALPDRGDCEWCTATPCDTHADERAAASAPGLAWTRPSGGRAVRIEGSEAGAPGNVCRSVAPNGLLCTREPSHPGRHLASRGDCEVVAAWPGSYEPSPADLDDTP